MPQKKKTATKRPARPYSPVPAPPNHTAAYMSGREAAQKMLETISWSEAHEAIHGFLDGARAIGKERSEKLRQEQLNVDKLTKAVG